MTQSWEGKDLRHLENITIRSPHLWSHLPRPTCAVIILPIIPSFLPSFHNTRSPSCYNYILYHGFLNAIISDKGTSFTSAVLVTIYRILGIKRRLFLVNHPETNGATVYANQVI